MHDHPAQGVKILIFEVVDIFLKFSPLVDPQLSYRLEELVRLLELVNG